MPIMQLNYAKNCLMEKLRPFAHHKRLLPRARRASSAEPPNPAKRLVYLALIERMKQYEKSTVDPPQQ